MEDTIEVIFARPCQCCGSHLLDGTLVEKDRLCVSQHGATDEPLALIGRGEESWVLGERGTRVPPVRPVPWRAGSNLY